MKNTVIAGHSSYYIVITTIIYALLAPIFLEMDHAYGQEVNSVTYGDKTMTYNQPVEVETECNSPCPSSAEMCIEMCS
jgi:hypothetical protein